MESHGALVGWTHHALGDRLVVTIETVASMNAADAHQPDVFRIMMTRNQAAILGSYLVGKSGLQQPRPQGFFRRLFS